MFVEFNPTLPSSLGQKEVQPYPSIHPSMYKHLPFDIQRTALKQQTSIQTTATRQTRTQRLRKAHISSPPIIHILPSRLSIHPRRAIISSLWPIALRRISIRYLLLLLISHLWSGSIVAVHLRVLLWWWVAVPDGGGGGVVV
jgi:hypothetical protein